MASINGVPMFASNNHKLYNYIKMSINHTRTLNVVLLYMYIESKFVLYVTLPLRGSLIGTIIIIITHLKSSKNKHHCHCHNILSQKQLCHSSLKQNYIQCIFLIALNYK